MEQNLSVLNVLHLHWVCTDTCETLNANYSHNALYFVFEMCEMGVKATCVILHIKASLLNENHVCVSMANCFCRNSVY